MFPQTERSLHHIINVTVIAQGHFENSLEEALCSISLVVPGLIL